MSTRIQELPENKVTGGGPAESGPEREEAFSVEEILRELEAAMQNSAPQRESGKTALPARPAEPPVPKESPALKEPLAPKEPPVQAKADAPDAAQAAAADEEHLTLQGLLEELEASEETGRRKKARGPVRAGKKPRRFRRGAAVFVTLLLALAVMFQFVGFAVIDGASMTPALSEHDFLVYWKFPDEIDRGEVLLCRSEGYSGQILAKRVIGLPGDEVEVDENGRVTLNGEPYTEATAMYGASEWGSDVRFPLLVEEDCYFVLGDNRAVSIDSRQSVIGQIARQDVVGKVICWFHME